MDELGPGGEDTFIGHDEDFSPTFAMTIAGAQAGGVKSAAPCSPNRSAGRITADAGRVMLAPRSILNS
jgi:hypothetical protein